MLKDLQNFLKKNESAASMFLGALVVVLLALLAYNYFRARQTEFPPLPPIVEEETEGELTAPGLAVALPVTHKVAAGETLWSIAEKYYFSGYNYEDIASANDLSGAKIIEIGQELTIPKVSPRQPLTVPQTVAPQITDARIEGESYLVVSGDYLWNIALRAYGDAYRWTEIAQANKLANPNIIHPGNVLTIPR